MRVTVYFATLRDLLASHGGGDLVEGPSDDCDADGVPDECQDDCNTNGVFDGCDIANGTSADCNGDGIPDECDLVYALDDGTFESGVGLGQPADFIWLNHFTVLEGQERIVAIGTQWRSSTPDGIPALLRLYADPDDDGDPAGAALLASTQTRSAWTARVRCGEVSGPSVIRSSASLTSRR